MHTLLIILIVIGSLGLITASILPSTIDSDLSEINKLEHDSRRFSPLVARRLVEGTCQMTTQCCPQAKSMYLSMILSGQTKGLPKQCFGEESASSFLSKALSCPPFVTMSTLIENPQLTKYFSIISKKPDPDIKLSNIMRDNCTEKEIYSMACDWDNFDQQESCRRKAYQTLAGKGGDKAYKDQIQQAKDMYMSQANLNFRQT